MDRQSFGIGDIVPDVIEKLGDGRILTRYAGGLSVVASEHTKILFEERREDDKEGEIGIIIEPPELDIEGIHQAAALYRAAGRSPEADQRAVRFSTEEAQAHASMAPPYQQGIRPFAMGPPGTVYDSGRIEIDSSVFWAGAFTRYYAADEDANAYYLVDGSQATGHGKGVWYLRTGRSEHRYREGVEIVKYDPESDIKNLGNCHEVGFGISAYGVTVDTSTTVCPDSISININDPNRFFAQWNGSARADNPGVVVHTVARVPNGHRNGFRYKIHEFHSVYG
jgi:hypothetical protein